MSNGFEENRRMEFDLKFDGIACLIHSPSDLVSSFYQGATLAMMCECVCDPTNLRSEA